MRTKWTDAMVETQLLEASSSVGGRMPSASELRSLGLNALACRIVRTPGGYAGWAKRLGLALKDSDTAFGRHWEGVIADVLCESGRVVARQTVKAPFDLLVNGRVRVNVKAARWHEYGPCKGFFFGVGYTWRNCDVLALVKVSDSSHSVLWVPSSHGQQQTITLTPHHHLNAFTSMSVLDAEY